MSRPLRVGLVGAGLIGNKRAAALRPIDQLVWVVDKDAERAKRLADSKHSSYYTQWTEVLNSDVDAVIIATTNDIIPECASAFLKAGKSVLIEKPGGRTPGEVKNLCELALETSRRGQKLRVGFNHRFHPGLHKLKQLVKSGEYGDLMYIRARYGHGGRLGYDKEWRADAKISGGGELLDQGVHLIDLANWIGGDFELQAGHVQTFFWKMPVEDNGFLMLRSPDGERSAFLHASCTEWKNLFDFEVFLKSAKLQVWGLGRSYGTEELRIYHMLPEMGPPNITVETFPGEDQSWHKEWEAFSEELSGNYTDIGKPEDALSAMKIVHQAYHQSQKPFAR